MPLGELELHAEGNATEQPVVKTVEFVDRKVASDVGGEGSGLGQLDRKSKAEANVAEAIDTICTFEVVVVVRAVTDVGTGNEADGVVDLDFAVHAEFEEPAFDSEVIVSTDADVKRTSLGSQGKTHFVTVFEDEVAVALMVIPAIAEAQFRTAEVGDDTGVQLKALIGGAVNTEEAVISRHSIGGAGVKTNGAGKRQSPVEGGGEPVISEVETTEDILGVITGAQREAEVVFSGRRRSAGGALLSGRSGAGEADSRQSEASHEGECELVQCHGLVGSFGCVVEVGMRVSPPQTASS